MESGILIRAVTPVQAMVLDVGILNNILTVAPNINPLTMLTLTCLFLLLFGSFSSDNCCCSSFPFPMCQAWRRGKGKIGNIFCECNFVYIICKKIPTYPWPMLWYLVYPSLGKCWSFYFQAQDLFIGKTWILYFGTQECLPQGHVPNSPISPFRSILFSSSPCSVPHRLFSLFWPSVDSHGF